MERRLIPDAGFTYFDVCVCGHPVSRHELAKTEYARCSVVYPQKCHCVSEVGGCRAVLRVEENPDGSSMTKTYARFFKRHHWVDKPLEHPLTGGLRKAREVGVWVEWLIDTCDRCGLEWDGDFVALATDSEGKTQREIREFVGKTILLCGICNSEDRYLWEQSQPGGYGLFGDAGIEGAGEPGTGDDSDDSSGGRVSGDWHG